MKPEEKLIVALDVPTFEKARQIIDTLSPVVRTFKVGLQLYTACGPKIIEAIHDKGAKVFLDLKFHDIPNTVAKVAEVATELGVFMFNVHAAGGEEMMRAALKASEEKAKSLKMERPLIIAVTVLTSFSQESFDQTFGTPRKIAEQVKHCALMAQRAGLDGVVASAREIELIRQNCGNKFVIVTPGIRPAEADKQDQKRTMTPKEAIQTGSSFLVIGRPILAASSPSEAANKMLKEIS